MDNHTFAAWLRGEAASARCALLTLFERRDMLLYIKGPELEKEYMEKVGTYEETVIKEEIECQLLRKKQQMIQTALNRRETIDEAAIDAELGIERRQMFAEAAGGGEPQAFADLTAEQSDILQELYHEIVRDFHPQMHPDLTEAHRQLFQKAQDAYRRRDLEELKLIHEMLTSRQDDDLAAELLLRLLSGAADGEDGGDRPDKGCAADYTLAAVIYDSFQPTAEEAVLQNDRERYRQMTDAVMKEMEEMRSQFPYAAADMLSDPAKVEAYKEDLAHRLRVAADERDRRSKEIRAMIDGMKKEVKEGGAVHG